MKIKYILMIVGSLLIVMAITLAVVKNSSCDAKGTCVAKTETTQADKIAREVKDGALLVDVREADEFAASHAKGAINVPLSQIQAGHFPTENKATKLYLYCHSGRRAGIAATLLKEAGYDNVTVIGGLDDWQAMGGDVA